MPQRSYGQFCGISKALDLVGERWTLLVVRDLMLGPLRFTDLMAGLPGIATDLLADRLRKLEAAGIVGQRRLPPPAASKVYDLTERGRELGEVLFALGRWGASLLEPGPGPQERVDVRWALLSIAGSYSGPHELRECSVLELGEETYSICIAGGRAEVRRGAVAHPAVVARTEVRPLLAVLTKCVSLDRAIAQRWLQVSGDVEALRRLLAHTRLVVGLPTGVADSRPS